MLRLFDRFLVRLGLRFGGSRERHAYRALALVASEQRQARQRR